MSRRASDRAVVVAREPPVSVCRVTTVPPADGLGAADAWPVPPLFARLVDDTSLLQPRGTAPGTADVVARFLAARDGRYGGLVGQLVCPVSRLAELVTELARAAPARPVDVSMVVDTGLGAVPKALSTVFSRSGLLTPRTIETAAPPDVDGVWLDRVAEFVPEEVVAVVEPRRPVAPDPDGTALWLRAVRRVADQGYVPKLRCGGTLASEVPSAEDVEEFVRVVAGTGRRFTTSGLRRAVRPGNGVAGAGQHGILNLVVAVARALSGGDVQDALASSDGEALAKETVRFSEQRALGVRGLLDRCGVDPEPLPAVELIGLGVLD